MSQNNVLNSTNILNSTNNGAFATDAPAILVADNLHKFYGSRAALRGLSFNLIAGRILGFLGPNGAGKTTAIRILTTILEPSSGHFSVDGVPSTQPDQVRRKIGVLPESLGFAKNMTALELLSYFGQLYGQSARDAKSKSLTLLEEVGLQTRAKSLIGSYSRGMRQRLGIARALVNDPAVIFLDEPTLGLDPRGQQDLLTLIRRITNERKVGVIFCSHQLPEVESLCSDVIIMRSGQMIANGTVSDVVARAQRNIFRIQVPIPMNVKAQEAIEQTPNAMVTILEESPDWLEVRLVAATEQNDEQDRFAKNKTLEALIRAEVPILNFQTEGGRLQDVFLQLTEEVAA